MWYDKDGSLVVDPPEGMLGFVYLITHIPSGRLYVGKKLLKFSRTKMVAGKKKKVKIDSDWMTYYGSSDEVKTLVVSDGTEAFRREILHWCKTKSECNYLETYEIFTRHCLLDQKYFNGWVSCKIHKKHVLGKISLP